VERSPLVLASKSMFVFVLSVRYTCRNNLRTHMLEPLPQAQRDDHSLKENLRIQVQNKAHTSIRGMKSAYLCFESFIEDNRYTDLYHDLYFVDMFDSDKDRVKAIRFLSKDPLYFDELFFCSKKLLTEILFYSLSWGGTTLRWGLTHSQKASFTAPTLENRLTGI